MNLPSSIFLSGKKWAKEQASKKIMMKRGMFTKTNGPSEYHRSSRIPVLSLLLLCILRTKAEDAQELVFFSSSS